MSITKLQTTNAVHLMQLLENESKRNGMKKGIKKNQTHQQKQKIESNVPLFVVRIEYVQRVLHCIQHSYEFIINDLMSE